MLEGAFLLTSPLLVLVLRRLAPIKRFWDYLSASAALLFLIPVGQRIAEESLGPLELVAALVGTVTLPFALLTVTIGVMGRGAMYLARRRLVSTITDENREFIEATLDRVSRFEARWLGP